MRSHRAALASDDLSTKGAKSFSQGRSLAEPLDEFIPNAQAASRRGKPSMMSYVLNSDPAELTELLRRVAACLSRAVFPGATPWAPPLAKLSRTFGA